MYMQISWCTVDIPAVLFPLLYQKCRDAMLTSAYDVERETIKAQKMFK